MTIAPEVLTRFTKICARGLTLGVGDPAGQLCIMSALCLALGEPHSDTPSCVADEDRRCSLAINDRAWSTPQARAEALLPLGIAQLGTAGTDRAPWVRRVAKGMTQRLLPLYLRALADRLADETYAPSLRAVADRCETEGTAEAAREAAGALARARALALDRALDRALASALALALALALARALDLPRADGLDLDLPRADGLDRALALDLDLGDESLRLLTQIALDAYAAEGRP